MPPSDTIRLDLPASRKYLNVVTACVVGVLARLDNIEDREAVTQSVELAVHEICVNIVDHAYRDSPGGRMEIVVNVGADGRNLTIDIHDTGKDFDPASVPEPAPEQLQVHGYGLFLVRQLMDQVVYIPQPQGNTWHLVKHLLP